MSLEVSSLRRWDSSPSDEVVGGFISDFELIRTVFMHRVAIRSETAQIWTRDHPSPSLMDTSRVDGVEAPQHVKTPRSHSYQTQAGVGTHDHHRESRGVLGRRLGAGHPASDHQAGPHVIRQGRRLGGRIPPRLPAPTRRLHDHQSVDTSPHAGYICTRSCRTRTILPKFKPRPL